jgi:tetratricopeptide (TPR) repeat protein
MSDSTWRGSDDVESDGARRRRLVSSALVVAAVLVVFGRTLAFPFLRWDDPTAVTENPLLHPPSWRQLGAIWSAPWSGLYIPASFSAYWLEMRASQMLGNGALPDARVFHAGLLGLHAGCALLVLRVLRRLVTDERAALFGALVFAIHPLQVESVAWITETRGVLAALFGLAALDVYVAGAQRVGGATQAQRASSTLLFALALLSKPTAVAIPLVALVIDRFVLLRPWKRVLPLFATWIAVVAIVVLVTSAQQGGASIHFTTPLWARPLVALDALSFYAEKLVWPLDLVADYGRKPAWLLAQPWFWLQGLPIVVLAVALVFVPVRRTALVALALFVAALAPVLGLFPFDFQAISTVADRYAYLALIAPAFALASFLARVHSRNAAVAVAVVVIALSIGSMYEVSRWRDTQTLFRRTLDLNPRSHIAYVHLGVADEESGRRRDAAEKYERALELEPGYPIAATNLARLMLDAGKVDEAIELLRDAVARNPDYPYAAQKLAIALARRGSKAAGAAKAKDLEEAERVLRDLMRIQPAFPGGHLTLGQILLEEGRAREALDEFARTLELAPSAEAHRGLSQCYAALGDRAQAEEHARRAASPRGDN